MKIILILLLMLTGCATVDKPKELSADEFMSACTSNHRCPELLLGSDNVMYVTCAECKKVL